MKDDREYTYYLPLNDSFIPSNDQKLLMQVLEEGPDVTDLIRFSLENKMSIYINDNRYNWEVIKKWWDESKYGGSV